MRKLMTIIAVLFCFVASAQYTPTGSKTRFVNGIGLGTKSDAAFGTVDSLVLYAAGDSTLKFKYKGNARALAYASQLPNDSLGVLVRLKAGRSGGIGVYANNWTQIAQLGAGGSAAATFYGFAGYNSNVGSGYTARSFTDKNFVDSSRALDVQLAGTQTITGAKTFSTIVNGSAFKATGNIEAVGTVYASGSSGGRNIGLIYDNTNDLGIISAQSDLAGKDVQIGRVGYSTNTYNIGKFYTDEYKIQPNGTNYLGNTVNATNTFAGVYYLQAGGGSANYGGGFLMYGHSHASKPGWIEAGISNGSGGKFSVNTQGLGTGTSVFNVDASGTTFVYSLGTGTVYSNSGTLTNTNPSDSTIKNTIKPLGYGLAEVLKLQPKTFYYNSDSAKTSLKYGFIAQEVKPIMPDLVRKISKGSDKLGLETDGIYVTLVKAIQEQQVIIDDLKKRIIALENK